MHSRHDPNRGEKAIQSWSLPFGHRCRNWDMFSMTRMRVSNRRSARETSLNGVEEAWVETQNFVGHEAVSISSSLHCWIRKAAEQERAGTCISTTSQLEECTASQGCLLPSAMRVPKGCAATHGRKLEHLWLGPLQGGSLLQFSQKLRAQVSAPAVIGVILLEPGGHQRRGVPDLLCYFTIKLTSGFQYNTCPLWLRIKNSLEHSSTRALRDAYKSPVILASPRFFLSPSMSPIHYVPAHHFDARARARIPMNPSYSYGTGEASSSARIQPQMASPSHFFPNDLPDLYYDDENMSTPPSATCSNITCTTPQEWRRPWDLPAEGKNTTPSYSPSTWDAPSLRGQGVHPAVAPIDPNFDWLHQQPLLGAQHSPMCFDSYGALAAQELGTYSPSYSQPVLLAQPLNFTGPDFASPQSSTLPSSPLSETVSPAALHLPAPVTAGCYPPPASQAPVKLHQPRPSRHIPIISLSKLASACEDISSPSHRKEPRSDVLSPPLDYDINTYSSVLPTIHHDQFVQRSIPPSHYPHCATLPTVSNESEAMIFCNCGCMASYTF
ncbi:unnamed protein product [Cyclocybe aegerita]|uniref:Uncharacterized protein n=1 Tax=Cyclocybe aegerita TaxID=1973307 RepID=A0A8S0VRT9_CYCAE|nr:unnamed protein product [Cyclocybe aegerita]